MAGHPHRSAARYAGTLQVADRGPTKVVDLRGNWSSRRWVQRFGGSAGCRDKNEEREHEAEIHRLKGELLLRRDESDAAEAQVCFQRAIEIARKQSANAELRRLMALGLIAKIFDDHGVRDFTQTEGRKRRIEKWFRLTHAVKNI